MFVRRRILLSFAFLWLVAGCAQSDAPVPGRLPRPVVAGAVDLRPLQRLEHDLEDLGVTFAVSGSEVVSRFPAKWKEYRELDSGERRPLRASAEKLAGYATLTGALLRQALSPGDRAAITAKAAAAARLHFFIGARLRLQEVLVQEFKLAEADVRFSQEVLESDGERVARTFVLISPAWEHATPLGEVETLRLERAALLVQQFVQTAERLEPEWHQPPAAYIGKILGDRLRAARPLLRFLEARSGEDTRRILGLREEIKELGIIIDAERDYSDARNRRKRPVIKYQGGDRTGLSFASSFSNQQRLAQEEMKKRLLEFEELVTRKLSDWQGIDYTFTAQLEAQSRCAKQLERYIEMRRAEVDVIGAVNALQAGGVLLEWTRNTERVAVTAPDWAGLSVIQRETLHVALKDLRQKLQHFADLDTDIEGVFLARYQAYYLTRRFWLQSEISATDTLIEKSCSR